MHRESLVSLSFLMVPMFSGCGLQEQSEVWGVASLSVVNGDSIRITDRTTAGDGRGLSLRNAQQHIVEDAVIKTGETLSLSDGRHAFDTYKLLRIQDGKVILQFESRFDARSFGDGVKTERKTIVVAPYSDKASSSRLSGDSLELVPQP